jgi:[ribosomal protein S18]-alanine N-acetyltransferase
MDAAAMAEVHGASFDDPWSALFVGALLNQPGVYALAGPSTTMGGFIIIRIAADEAEVLTIGVRPTERQRGLGKSLLSAAIELMKDNGVVRCFLEVAEDNAAAKALYAGLGFSLCARRPKYYGSGPIQTDALVMERVLAAD